MRWRSTPLVIVFLLCFSVVCVTEKEHSEIASDVKVGPCGTSRAVAVYITNADNISYEFTASRTNITTAHIWMKVVCEKYNPVETVQVEPKADTDGWDHTLIPDKIEITENGRTEHPFVLILAVPPLEENTTKRITFSGSYIALGNIRYGIPDVAADFTFTVNVIEEVTEEPPEEKTDDEGLPSGVIPGIIAGVLVLGLVLFVVIKRKKQ